MTLGRSIPIDFPEERIILPLEKARARIGPRNPGGYIAKAGCRKSHDVDAGPSPWTVLAAAAATTIAMGGVYLYYSAAGQRLGYRRPADEVEAPAPASDTEATDGGFHDVGNWSEAQMPNPPQQSTRAAPPARDAAWEVVG